MVQKFPGFIKKQPHSPTPMTKVLKLRLGIKKRCKKKRKVSIFGSYLLTPSRILFWIQRSKKNQVAEVGTQMEDGMSCISSSSQPTLPGNSPNTSVQMAQSRGSDQKPETSNHTPGSFFQNPDNVSVNGGQFNLGPTVTIHLTREFGLFDPWSCVYLTRPRIRLSNGTGEPGMYLTLLSINLN